MNAKRKLAIEQTIARIDAGMRELSETLQSWSLGVLQDEIEAAQERISSATNETELLERALAAGATWRRDRHGDLYLAEVSGRKRLDVFEAFVHLEYIDRESLQRAARDFATIPGQISKRAKNLDKLVARLTEHLNQQAQDVREQVGQVLQSAKEAGKRANRTLRGAPRYE